MKLLALRLCAHDSNVTYFDGEQLKYKSFERDFQVKHFGFEGIYAWTRILDEWNIIVLFLLSSLIKGEFLLIFKFLSIINLLGEKSFNPLILQFSFELSLLAVLDVTNIES